ncbi:MAG: hypothetical protein N2258_06025 [Brevinematales bacterium]|nr:hypothetical protein [Brevinematales bacterium]
MKERIKEIVNETISEMGFVCVEVNFVFSKNTKKLMVVIYKNDGSISMNDCADVSNVLRRRLDIDVNGFSDNYDLIVESPGANRKLKNLKEVEIFKNREIEFFVKPSLKVKENKIIGRVNEIINDKLKIESGNNIYEIYWDDITTARLYFDLKKYINRGGQ